LAVVNSVVVDPNEGVFCGITLMPSEIEETARLGAAYAGNGFGFYAPPRVDDEVMVCAPSGDPSQGLVITGRLWSPSDVPPAEAASNPQDVLLKVEEGQTLRLLVSGGGKIVMGDEASAKGVARLDDTTANGTFSITSAGTIATFNYTPPGSVVPVVIGSINLGTATITPGSATLSGKINSASETVEAS
jgi:hypothetical protein